MKNGSKKASKITERQKDDKNKVSVWSKMRQYIRLKVRPCRCILDVKSKLAVVVSHVENQNDILAVKQMVKSG